MAAYSSSSGYGAGPQPVSLSTGSVLRLITAGRTESASLWDLTVMSMFTCHCEVAPAQPVVGGTETEQVSRQRGENILKAGTACAMALRFESLTNEEAVPCAAHAEPTPASSSAGVGCLPWASSGCTTRALVASVLHGSAQEANVEEFSYLLFLR